MNLPLKVSNVALGEVVEIQRYLEQARAGTGVRFRAELEHCFSIIQQYPGGARTRYRCYRLMPILTFNDHVIYSVRTNCIVSIACATCTKDR